MNAIIDSSFMMACMRKQIDFLAQLKQQGFSVKVPREVVQELKDKKKSSKSSREDRSIINSLLEMLQRKKVKHTTSGKQKLEDWFVERGTQGTHIATTNASIKNRVPNVIQIFESNRTVGLRP